MDSKKTAIILVDDANDFLSERGKLNGAVKQVIDGNNVLDNINNLVKRARAKGLIVIHVPLQFSADYREMGDAPYGIFSVVKESGAFQRGSWGAEVADDLDVQDSDIVINGKSTTCAFATTDLDSMLKKYGITAIALGGLLTNICIESTMRTAYDKGYEVYTLTDCAATLSDEQQRVAIEHDWPMFSKPVSHSEFLKLLD